LLRTTLPLAVGRLVTIKDGPRPRSYRTLPYPSSVLPPKTGRFCLRQACQQRAISKLTRGTEANKCAIAVIVGRTLILPKPEVARAQTDPWQWAGLVLWPTAPRTGGARLLSYFFFFFRAA
jgi:hypothetical protein